MIGKTGLIRGAALLAAAVLPAPCAAATYTEFADRPSFSLATGAKITDRYEDPGYQSVMTDAQMSAVFGQATYFTYGGNVTDYNNVLPGFGVNGSYAYCSLCYGSFRLAFATTSMAVAGAIYGVGLDVTLNAAAAPPFKYSATVAFADGQVSSFELPYVPESYPAHPDARFWGITSDEGIVSIDFVSHATTGDERTYLIIDNLTIASPVPLPAPLLPTLAAAGWLARLARRGRRVQFTERH
ncbi:MAG: hypothetical protein AB7Q97_08415 [Gammaproteobacteria bacterium]